MTSALHSLGKGSQEARKCWKSQKVEPDFRSQCEEHKDEVFNYFRFFASSSLTIPSQKSMELQTFSTWPSHDMVGSHPFQ
jgi:hypothetical protein